ncbi:hypothetical protein AAVH_36297, partial [Aphelenchoides avenae]
AEPAAGSPTLGGHLIFGADSENSMCFDEWTVVDTTLPEFTGQSYGVNVEGFFANELDADYDFRRATFTVDCDTISTFPDIVFQITKAAPALDMMDYRVPANVYAKKASFEG